MKEQKQFNWHKFLTTSMIATGVGFFLLSLILPDIIWKDEDFSVDFSHHESEQIQAKRSTTNQFADSPVSVPRAQELTEVIAFLERMDKDHTDEEDVEESEGEIADESPDISIDEPRELPADFDSLGEEEERSGYSALELEEEKRTYNLYEYAPEGFEEYVKYDWSRSVDEQLTARYFPPGDKQKFLDFIDQYDRRAWIFYHPYSLDIYVFMGHLIE